MITTEDDDKLPVGYWRYQGMKVGCLFVAIVVVVAVIVAWRA